MRKPSSSGENLSKKVIRGGFWVFALRIVQQVFGIIRLIVLARLLAPSDFGLLGIALLTMAALETFSQTGFQEALIQKKEKTKDYLNSAWTVLILRSFVLFAILYLIAPYAAIFFKVPQAKFIIQVVGLSVLFQGFTNIGVIYFQKELKFNKQFIYQISGTLVDFIVTISAALILKNVWALVFGLLAGNIVRFVVSYFVHPYRPRLTSNLKKAKELFGFGKWILGSTILTFLLVQGDDILVGKLLGIAMLGLYQMAYRMSNMPATEISHLIATVTFPAYSKLQDNLLRLKEAYLKVLQLTAFLSIPIAGLIFILAPDFTKIFLGEKWMPMVSTMQVLAFYGMLRAIGATTGSVFLAIGKPGISTKIKFGALILLAVVIYPLTKKWGIMGTAIAVTSFALIFCNLAVIITSMILKLNYKQLITAVFYPFIMTFIMVIIISILKNYVLHDITLINFITLGFVGLFVYLIWAYLFDLFFNYGCRQLIYEQIKALFRK